MKWHSRITYIRQSIHMLDNINDEVMNKLQEGGVICSLCGRLFKSMICFRLHLQNHVLEPTFICHICDETVTEEEEFDQHVASHSSVNHGQQESLQEQVIHQENARSLDEERCFDCDVCEWKFTVEELLNQHLMSHDRSHENQDPVVEKVIFKEESFSEGYRFDCGVCKSKFTYEELIKQHQISHAKNPAFSYRECPVTCTGESDLPQNLELNGGESFINHKQAGFPSNVDCEDNLQNFFKVNCFKCGVCDRKFAEKELLTQHFLSHAKEPLMCKVCDEPFAKAGDQMQHLKSHDIKLFEHDEHRGPTAANGESEDNFQSFFKEKGFECGGCDGKSPERELFKNNHFNNAEESQCWCHLCEKTFIGDRDLMQHLDSHARTTFVDSDDERRSGESVVLENDTRSLSGKNDVVQHLDSSGRKSFVDHECPGTSGENVVLENGGLSGKNGLMQLLHSSDRKSFADHECPITSAESVVLENGTPNLSGKNGLMQHLDSSESMTLVDPKCSGTSGGNVVFKNETQNFSREKSLTQHLDSSERKSFVDSEHTGTSREIVVFKNNAQSIQQNTSVETDTLTKYFICRVCNSLFKEKRTYELHLGGHVARPPYICFICQQTFAQGSHLKCHLETHSEYPPFVCHMCNETFTEKNFYCHLKMDTDGKYFVCDIQKKFPPKYNARDQNQTSTGINSIDFDEETSAPRYLPQHHQTPTYISSIARVSRRKIFPMKSKVESHDQETTSKNTFACRIYKNSFRYKANVLVRKTVRQGLKPFVCKICHKSFTQKGNLETHRRLHTGKKPFTCEQCGKAYAQEINLIVHVRSHTGEKPYVCNICNKGFSSKGNLYTHKKIHSDIKQFVCSTCNKSFAQKINFINHKTRHLQG